MLKTITSLSFWGGLASVAGVLLWVGSASAQGQGGGGGGSGGIGAGGGGTGGTGGGAGGIGAGGGAGGGGMAGGTGGLGSGGGFAGGASGGISDLQGGGLASGFAVSGGTQRASSFFSSNSNNPFVQYYANPLTAGKPGTSTGATAGGRAATGGFGLPLYAAATATGRTGTSANTRRSSAGSSLNLGSGFRNNASTMRAYTTTYGEGAAGARPMALTRVHVDIQEMLGRSSMLPSGGQIRVERDGEAVVLRGQVLDDGEKRLAENMARLTPGVRVLRNELTVRSNGGARQ